MYILYSKMFKDISNFNNLNDYLYLLNGILITDLSIIFLTNMRILNSRLLDKWYKTFLLSAVISDITIVMIAFVIARALYSYLFNEFSIVKFIIVAVVIQVIHDTLFYIFFTIMPRGKNKMIDIFKDYAKELSYKAILADSGLMISSAIISSYLANFSININIIILLCTIYVLQFILYNN